MTSDLSISYLSKLYSLMIEELQETCDSHATLSDTLLSLIDHLDCIYEQYLSVQSQPLTIGTVEETMLWTEYEAAAGSFANALNARATIATCYSSMGEYWRDAQDQVVGKSPNTIWDVYEHGSRRRLEACLAKELNVESALLLNSGMSAIYVAMSTIGLKATDHVFVGKSSYFETNEVLEHFAYWLGCRIHSIDFLDIFSLERAVRKFSPKLMVVEAATNCPTPELLPDFSKVSFGAKFPVIICDQTIIGFPETDYSLNYLGDVIYVASLSKFVTNRISAGTIFGQASMVDSCRAVARFSGQNLQEHAFNFIRRSDITCVNYRMQIHQRNVQFFVQALTEVKSNLSLFRTLGQDYLSLGMDDCDVKGCLIFLALKPIAGLDCFASELVERHRVVVQFWQHFGQGSEMVFDIRSGFGWNKTSVRCYESSQLNQANAPSYIRISVGLESQRVAINLAAQLVDSIREVTHEIV